MRQRPEVFHKSPSPPPPLQKQVRQELAAPMRPQNSRIKALNKTSEKECDWRVKPHNLNNNHQRICRGDHFDTNNTVSRRSSGAGDPKAGRPNLRTSTARLPMPRESFKSSIRETDSIDKNLRGYPPITTYRTSQAPVIKSVNDARNYLMRTSIYSTEREKQLNASVMVTPHYTGHSHTTPRVCATAGTGPHVTPWSYSAASKIACQPQTRRRLGRSPSPPARMSNEQSRATNTPSPTEKFLVKDASKSALRDVLSRLKLSMCRDGSLGVASLGATREAPAPRRAPSVRSDDRPLATQGDMLNSIKFQRRLRDTIVTEKTGGFHEKPNGSKDKHSAFPRSFNNAGRPMSPKGRRSAQTTSDAM